MRASDDSAALVQGTIDMAHRLGKDVVAEGVEDELTAERLRAMKCDQAQGFMFARPVAVPELANLLTKRGRADWTRPVQTGGTRASHPDAGSHAARDSATAKESRS